MNIANKLTIFRMLLIPIFLVVLFWPVSSHMSLNHVQIPTGHLLAALIFTIASLTDYLDGYLARKYQLVTTFGAFFDPMADKLLVIAALVSLVELQWIPSWIVIIIVSRELLVTGLRVLIAQSNGKVLSAALPGKIKTTTQMLAIICYLCHHFGISVMGLPLGNIFLYICLFFTVYSGLDYFYHARFVFKDISV